MMGFATRTADHGAAALLLDPDEVPAELGPVLGHIPVSQSFSIFGKLGASHVDHELEERSAEDIGGGVVRRTSTSTSSKEWLPTYGIGLMLHSPDVEWRLLFEHTEGKSGTELGSLQSLGVQAVIPF